MTLFVVKHNERGTVANLVANLGKMKELDQLEEVNVQTGLLVAKAKKEFVMVKF